jgi:hypothetical protein
MPLLRLSTHFSNELRNRQAAKQWRHLFNLRRVCPNQLDQDIRVGFNLRVLCLWRLLLDQTKSLLTL